MECNTENKEFRIEEFYNIFLKYPSVTTDTRNIKQGDIFFALKGENFNGNAFSQQAIDKGAALVVIDEEKYAINEKCFLVKDSLKALQLLAFYHRRQFPLLNILAITGTNGKTTTKELTYSIVSQKYNTIATIGNLNNHIGVPLTLLRINKDTEFAIIEMGANHQGEIEFLCNIAEPLYGLITNIGKAHLEGFGGFEGVIKTKTELFRYLDKPNHYPIINMDDKSLSHYATIHKHNFYSYSKQSEIKLDSNFLKSRDNLLKSNYAAIEFEGKEVYSNLVGTYNEENILAAMTIGKIFNIPIEQSIKAIADYKPQNHRSQILNTKNNTLILDCYNANPSSLTSALNDFKYPCSKPKYAFIGAMKELGNSSQKEHKAIIDILESMFLEKVILVGQEFKEFCIAPNSSFLWFSSSNEAKEYLLNNPIQGGDILIKGSHSTKMEVLIDAL